MASEFKTMAPLEFRGQQVAYVSRDGFWFGTKVQELYDYDEARALRDWLDCALDTGTSGALEGTVRGARQWHHAATDPPEFGQRVLFYWDGWGSYFFIGYRDRETNQFLDERGQRRDAWAWSPLVEPTDAAIAAASNDAERSGEGSAAMEGEET